MTLDQIIIAASGLGVGGVIVALIQKYRAPEDRRAIHATASKDEATGEAAVIGAMATAFTGTTGALRAEIDRMQSMLNELRERVVEAEADLRAGHAREAAQALVISDQKQQIDMAHADVVRIRNERDVAVEKTIMQEGEIRQLKAVIAAQSRAGET